MRPRQSGADIGDNHVRGLDRAHVQPALSGHPLRDLPHGKWLISTAQNCQHGPGQLAIAEYLRLGWALGLGFDLLRCDGRIKQPENLGLSPPDAAADYYLIRMTCDLSTCVLICNDMKAVD